MVVLVPKFETIMSDYNYNQNLENKISLADNWQSQLATYNEQQQLLEEVYSKLFVSMPRNDEMSAIVELIFSQGRKAGIKIHRITPVKPEKQSSFTELTLILKSSGSFHQMLKFINELEQANHLVRLNRLLMSADENPVSGFLNSDIQLSFMVVQNNLTEDGDYE
jgi:Tfp pilus assembly protein PilO